MTNHSPIATNAVAPVNIIIIFDLLSGISILCSVFMLQFWFELLVVSVCPFSMSTVAVPLIYVTVSLVAIVSNSSFLPRY